MAFSDGCQKSDEKQFPDGPETIIESSTSYIDRNKMDSDDSVIERFRDHTTKTNNIDFRA